MSANVLATGLAGAMFGAALKYSKVYLPSVIISQMQLTSFHMLKVFLGASGTSALVVAILERNGIRQVKPRSASSMGWFGVYDGNVIGGLLIGIGMALSGACPGTVFVQLITGIRSGRFAMLGGILAGILHARVSHYIRSPRAPASAPANKLTIHGKLNLDAKHVLWAFETACLAVIAATTLLRTEDVSLTPLLAVCGALLIGAAQAASLLLTSAAVGCSSTFSEIGQHFWRTLDGKGPAPSTRSMIFAVGMLVGAWALPQSSPPMAESQISDVTALVGGFVMVFGARLAGGCTSGHGISGLSTFSTASIVSVACMFAGGIGLAALLG